MQDQRKVIIPVFVPHKGCPNDCVFCNQRKITGCIEPAGSKDIEKAIEERRDTVDTVRDQLELAFFGGSFTMIPETEQEMLLEKANEYLKAGFLTDIRISTRPDGIDETVIKRLKKYGVGIVELGVQSMDEEVLKSSKRGYTPEQVEKAVSLLKQEGFMVGVQVMTGLPGSTLRKEIHTAERLCALKPHIARIYPTLVIKDTELESQFLNGTYTPQTLEEAVEASYEMLKIFQINQVQVIRIGLQPTDGIAEGKDVVAGPFHPSFGELVEGRIYRDKIEALIEKEIAGGTIETAHKTLYVHCAARDVSKASGHHRANKEYFMKKYGFRDVRIKPVHEMNGKQIEKNIEKEVEAHGENGLFVSFEFC